MSKSKTMLAVASSDPVLLEQKIELEKVGISVFRIDTMQEAITRFARGEKYLCVVINEDSIADFMELLPVLCGVARTHVFIVTHSYTKAKQTEAMQLGADAYIPFGANAWEDAQCTIVHLKLTDKWANRSSEKVSVLAYGAVVMLPEWRRIFINDTEVILPNREYSLFQYFLSNPNVVLSYSQIAESVWGCEENVTINSIQQHIKRIRKKLSDAGFKGEYIQNVACVGYRFSVHTPERVSQKA